MNPDFRSSGPIQVVAHSPLTCRGVNSYADSAYYTHGSGAGVFNAGTMRWVASMGGLHQLWPDQPHGGLYPRSAATSCMRSRTVRRQRSIRRTTTWPQMQEWAGDPIAAEHNLWPPVAPLTEAEISSEPQTHRHPGTRARRRRPAIYRPAKRAGPAVRLLEHQLRVAAAVQRAVRDLPARHGRGRRRHGQRPVRRPRVVSESARVVGPALMVMAIILFMGAVSGAHLNPVVSVAFALRGDFPWRRVGSYVLAQFAGASPRHAAAVGPARQAGQCGPDVARPWHLHRDRDGLGDPADDRAGQRRSSARRRAHSRSARWLPSASAATSRWRACSARQSAARR